MDIEELLKEYSKIFKFRRLFIRDLSITRRGFLYFLICFFFSTISLNFIVVHILEFSLHELLYNGLGLTFILAIFFTIVFAGFIVDKIKDRVRLLLIISPINIIGLILVIFGDFFQYVGLSLMILSTGLFIIDLLTIYIHESNILNRGRLLGYLFFISFIVSHLIILITLGNTIIIIIIESFLLISIYYISKNYIYRENEERLKSSKHFFQILTGTYHILGYLLVFLIFGFILGNAFSTYGELIISPFIFVPLFMLLFIIFGVALDNFGRKWTFSAGLLIISSIFLFAGIIQNPIIYNSIFFGVSIPIIFIILFTLSADFSTERSAIKYRARMICSFLLVFMMGLIAGVIIHFTLNQVYLSNQSFFYWIPFYLQGLSPFLLIVTLIWIGSLPEILSYKEADWADSLQSLYVFNSAAVCLYTKDFKPDQKKKIPSEDLITGGFTGIIGLISEITDQYKNLNIIDKEGVKIYFSYGKSVISALISTKDLPVLSKKLDIFTKSFEQQFAYELAHFTGKINPFSDAKKLIYRYFK
jgi:MFS family permease